MFNQSGLPLLLLLLLLLVSSFGCSDDAAQPLDLHSGGDLSRITDSSVLDQRADAAQSDTSQSDGAADSILADALTRTDTATPDGGPGCASFNNWTCGSVGSGCDSTCKEGTKSWHLFCYPDGTCHCANTGQMCKPSPGVTPCGTCSNAFSAGCCKP